MTDQRLAQFIEHNFDIDTLRKAGFFPKGMRRNNYETIAKRVCEFFGYESIFEYGPAEIHHVEGANCAYGKFPDKIGSDGTLKPGEGFLLSTAQGTFECPHCTCENDVKEAGHCFKQRCRGCKRQVEIVADHLGNVTVYEKALRRK